MSFSRSGGVAQQIPRNCLLLLMTAQVAVALPYVSQLSPGLILASIFCAGWRFGVYQGRWNFPGRWVKAGLVIGSLVAIRLSGLSPASLEAAASVLVLASALKLIETKTRRDAYVLMFLAYFIVATQFLFSQTLFLSVYQLAAIILVTAAMVAMNQPAARVRPLASLRLAGVLLLQALPLTVVIFLFFPRAGPLWSVPVPNSATTGLREQMTPGDVAQLGRSDDLAFRAVFDGTVPPPATLYWRALVYSFFAKGTWWVGPDIGRAQPGAFPATDSSSIGYEILLEPNYSTWLVALENSRPESPGVGLTLDARLEAKDPVLGVYRYRASTVATIYPDETISAELRRRETWLPDGESPRVRAHAVELRAATGDDRRFIAALLDEIRREPFFYTLNPPMLPREDSIDAFWFETRQGFCTHYAGAMVFMLRSAGVPARMVGGYQGGELNPITGHVVVRQYDAHAWVEAWLEDGGWVRIDPTGAVAPARIERGIAAALSQADRASISGLAGTRLGGMNILREALDLLDSLDHRWNLWVVGYDGEVQSGLLRRLLGEVTPTRLGIALLVAGAFSAGLVALLLFAGRRPTSKHPVERVFARFAGHCARLGLRRDPFETPGQYLLRVGSATDRDPTSMGALVASLNQLLYNPEGPTSSRDLQLLRRELRNLRLRLAFGARA